ncbi:hypothetical protein LI221_15175 [Faecalimonas umbilicata]|nr:hypothetical protein [Faecalimonas umbilicata]
MGKYRKYVAVVIKIFEIFQWVAALMLFVLIGAVGMFRVQLNGNVLGLNQNGGQISAHGSSVMLLEPDGMVNMKVFVAVLIIAMVSCILTAMIYHNIYLIVQTTRRVEYPQKEVTPFIDVNVKRVRNIGVYCMLIPIVECIVSVAARMVFKIEGIELGINIAGIVAGMIVLCLADVFTYGVELQKGKGL